MASARSDADQQPCVRIKALQAALHREFARGEAMQTWTGPWATNILQTAARTLAQTPERIASMLCTLCKPVHPQIQPQHVLWFPDAERWPCRRTMLLQDTQDALLRCMQPPELFADCSLRARRASAPDAALCRHLEPFVDRALLAASCLHDCLHRAATGTGSDVEFHALLEQWQIGLRRAQLQLGTAAARAPHDCLAIVAQELQYRCFPSSSLGLRATLQPGADTLLRLLVRSSLPRDLLQAVLRTATIPQTLDTTPISPLHHATAETAVRKRRAEQAMAPVPAPAPASRGSDAAGVCWQPHQLLRDADLRRKEAAVVHGGPTAAAGVVPRPLSPGGELLKLLWQREAIVSHQRQQRARSLLRQPGTAAPWLHLGIGFLPPRRLSLTETEGLVALDCRGDPRSILIGAPPSHYLAACLQLLSQPDVLAVLDASQGAAPLSAEARRVLLRHVPYTLRCLFYLLHEVLCPSSPETSPALAMPLLLPYIDHELYQHYEARWLTPRSRPPGSPKLPWDRSATERCFVLFFVLRTVARAHPQLNDSHVPSLVYFAVDLLARAARAGRPSAPSPFLTLLPQLRRGRHLMAQIVHIVSAVMLQQYVGLMPAIASYFTHAHDLLCAWQRSGDTQPACWSLDWTGSTSIAPATDGSTVLPLRPLEQGAVTRALHHSWWRPALNLHANHRLPHAGPAAQADWSIQLHVRAAVSPKKNATKTTEGAEDKDGEEEEEHSRPTGSGQPTTLYACLPLVTQQLLLQAFAEQAAGIAAVTHETTASAGLERAPLYPTWFRALFARDPALPQSLHAPLQAAALLNLCAALCGMLPQQLRTEDPWLHRFTPTQLPEVCQHQLTRRGTPLAHIAAALTALLGTEALGGIWGDPYHPGTSHLRAALFCLCYPGAVLLQASYFKALSEERAAALMSCAPDLRALQDAHRLWPKAIPTPNTQFILPPGLLSDLLDAATTPHQRTGLLCHLHPLPPLQQALANQKPLSATYVTTPSPFHTPDNLSDADLPTCLPSHPAHVIEDPATATAMLQLLALLDTGAPTQLTTTQVLRGHGPPAWFTTTPPLPCWGLRLRPRYDALLFPATSAAPGRHTAGLARPFTSSSNDLLRCLQLCAPLLQSSAQPNPTKKKDKPV